jgi:PKD repeat protein
LVPDQFGTDVDFSNTDEVDVPLTFTFDESWNYDEVELVAFIQSDGTKEVLHSTNIMLSELGGGAPGFTAGFYADATDYCEAPIAAYFHSDCNGDPISWNWSFPGGDPETSYEENPVVVYMEEGSYDVQLIVSDGSEWDTAYFEKYISVHGIPDVSWTDVPELCNEDWDPYTLTEGQPGGGEYSGDYVTEGMYFHPTEAGIGEHMITYTFTDEYGCINSADQTVSVVNCVGIGENEAVGLELFPNPTTGTLNLNISADQFNDADLSIIDAVGKEVYRQEGLNINGKYSTSIDLSEQPQGIYFVVINGEKQHVTKKVFLSK